jgi:hypothetical protein
LLRKVVRSLKPQCQIVITDFVRASKKTGPEFENWISHEGDGIEPWSIEQIQKCLGSLNVLTRITSDESDDYRSMVLKAWDKFMQEIDAHPLERELTIPLVNEAELWARRIAALESEDLRYFRILGVKSS